MTYAKALRPSQNMAAPLKRLMVSALAAGLSIFASAGPSAAQQRTIINPGFEEHTVPPGPPTSYYIRPDDVLPGWESTNGEIEAWRTGFLGVPARSGSYFIEMNPSAPTGLYQEVCIAQGEQLNWSFWHRARNGGANPQNATLEVRTTGGALVQPLASQNTAIGAGWLNNTGSAVFSGPTDTYRLQFRTTNPGSVGNFLDDVNFAFTAYAELAAASGSNVEASGGNMLALQVTGDVRTAQSVPFTISGGTAIEGEDYIVIDDVFEIAVPAQTYDGVSAASFIPLPIIILNDAILEGDDTIEVTLDAFSGPSLTVASPDCGPDPLRTATYTIINDDATPVAENDSALGNTPESTVSVAILGNDTDADGNLTIDQSSVSLVIPAGLDPSNVTIVDGDVVGLAIPGQGVWTYDDTTGLLTFDPIPGFIGNPDVISYTVDDDGPNTSAPATVTVTYLAPSPEITLTQTVTGVLDTNGNGVFGDAGDTITYVYIVENTGDTSLGGVSIDDTGFGGLPGSSTFTPEPGFDGDLSTSEGPVQAGTGTYVITPDDVTAGGVTTQPTVTSTAVATGAGNTPLPGAPLVTETGAQLPPVNDVSDAGSEPILDRATGAVSPIADPTGTGTQADPTVLILQTAGDFALTKTTPMEQVLIGQIVSYEIIATSMMGTDFGPTQIVDTLPEGMVFVLGSATVDGVAATPVVSGQTVTFSDLTMPANGSLTIALQAHVTSAAPAGRLTNTADLLDQLTGAEIASGASATVSRTVESVFDCSAVIGKVFDDVNMNGYQDEIPDVRAAITNQDIFVDKLGRGGKLSVTESTPQAEVGIPGVRLVTPSGTLITTDAHGRYSVPCAEIPSGIGSNFMLKIDTRTLPTGYRMTTENPRVMRLTSGLMTEMNFGAAVGRVMDVDLSARAYGTAEVAPSQALADGLADVLRQIAETPTVIRIAYYRDGEGSDLAHARLDAVEALIADKWAAIGSYRLLIEKTVNQLQ